jgi:hypothetical protein
VCSLHIELESIEGENNLTWFSWLFLENEKWVDQRAQWLPQIFLKLRQVAVSRLRTKIIVSWVVLAYQDEESVEMGNSQEKEVGIQSCTLQLPPSAIFI